ncbi:MAG TPA: hypothetical protein VN957_16370 [Chthoniobacterales bacterium]|nr:hypothetical protein [Chthoniobacterales bacterium]
MEDLSTAEMLSLRGGANSANVISVGNVAIAVPIDIVLFSGNAVGSGSKAGIGNILQLAEAQAGTQSFSFFGIGSK